jgi:hypothetical protein
VLDARPDAGGDKADAKSRKAERQRHNRQAGRGDEGRRDQRRAWGEAAEEPVGRDLEAAHRPVIERTNDGEPGIGQTELRLPQGQECVEAVGIVVMERMSETRGQQAFRLGRA